MKHLHKVTETNSAWELDEAGDNTLIITKVINGEDKQNARVDLRIEGYFCSVSYNDKALETCTLQLSEEDLHTLVRIIANQELMQNLAKTLELEQLKG